MNGTYRSAVRLHAQTALATTAFTAMAALAALTAPAGAQDLQPQPAQPEAVADSDTILVTARRREETLQETPVAISAFSGETLQARAITQTSDLERITPSLQFKPAGQLSGNSSASVVFIRGVGQVDPGAAVDPGVGIYIDEVYVGRSVGGTIEFGDIGSVEVLRGPQGTLFGRNTIGGAILIRTRQPELGETSASGRFRIGSYDLREGFAVANLPIGDNAAVRLSGGFRDRDGYVIRLFDGLDLGNDNVYTLNGSFRWDAAPGLDIAIRGDYTKRDENGAPFTFAGINENAPVPAIASVVAGCPGATIPYAPIAPGDIRFGQPFVPNIPDARCANDFQATANYRNGGTADVSSSSEVWGVSGTLSYDVTDELTLKSITAYRRTQSRGIRDADNTPFLILTTDVGGTAKQFSEELQLQYAGNGISAIVGGYYFDEDTVERSSIPLSFPPSPPVIARLLAGGPGTRDLQVADLETRSLAAFGEVSVEVTDRVELTGGLRYTSDRKSYTGIAFSVNPLDQPDPDPLPTLAIPEGGPLYIYPDLNRQTFNALTGSATAAFEATDWLNVYASYARSFKSGGFNTRYNAPPPGFVPISFDEETVDSYELGAKADWGDFTLNMAAFQADYTDIQLIFRQGPVPLLFNGGEARIRGFEAEASWRSDWGMSIDIGASTLDDDILSVTPVPGATATVQPGDDLPLTPSFQGNFSIAYEAVLDADHTLTPRFDGSYTSKVVFITGSVPEIEENGYFTGNFSLRLANEDAGWTLTGGVTNLFDERYLIQGNASLGTLGYSERIFARPREWYVQVGFEF